MALTMIDPASSWLEIVEIPTITRLTTKKVNGKERTIEEEIFDKLSDQISQLVNTRGRYFIYDNGSEFKLHFETLCGSCIQRKPTTIKNPKANAICERVHQILGTMMRTSEIDMANSVEPADINTSIDNTTWAFR
jgi:transposase InsO family protein